MLLNEMKLAGHSFRSWVQSTYLRLNLPDIMDLNNRVYLFSCGEVEDLELVTARSQGTKTNHFVRLMLVINMISITERQTNDIFLKVASLSVENIFTIYKKMGEILSSIEVVDSC
jgi:hypothetical protein